LVSFTPGNIYDITAVYQKPEKLPPIYSLAWDRKYNLDGVLAYSTGPKGIHDGYVQLFKNGIIEGTDASMLEPSGSVAINGAIFEQELMKSLSAYLSLMKELSVELPAYIFLSVLGVKGYTMATSRRRIFNVHHIDRDHLLVPEAVVHSYDTEAKDILRPCFDSVWNACGFPRSLCYDENGNWTGRA
jgi:hypothetical protein